TVARARPGGEERLGGEKAGDGAAGQRVGLRSRPPFEPLGQRWVPRGRAHKRDRSPFQLSRPPSCLCHGQWSARRGPAQCCAPEQVVSAFCVSVEPRRPMKRQRAALAAIVCALLAPRAKAATVSAGVDHTLVVASDGTVWAWGDNGSGQLGDGSTTSRLTPVQVRGLSNVVAVSAGNGPSGPPWRAGPLWGPLYPPNP